MFKHVVILASLLALSQAISFSANQATIKRDRFRYSFLNFGNVITDTENHFISGYGTFKAPYGGYYALHLCVPAFSRGVTIGLYTYSASAGRHNVVELRPSDAKCYSVVVYMYRNDYVYNLVRGLRSISRDKAREVTFSGYLVGERGVSQSAVRASSTAPSSFPAQSLIPESTGGTGGGTGPTDKPPFVQ